VSGDGNQYDYGFRIYNPRLGRFLSVDPLTRSFPWWSSYQFAGNQPITAIDLDGLEIVYVQEAPNNENSTITVMFSNGQPIGGSDLAVHRTNPDGQKLKTESQFKGPNAASEVNALNRLLAFSKTPTGQTKSSITSIVWPITSLEQKNEGTNTKENEKAITLKGEHRATVEVKPGSSFATGKDEGLGGFVVSVGPVPGGESLDGSGRPAVNGELSTTTSDFIAQVANGIIKNAAKISSINISTVSTVGEGVVKFYAIVSASEANARIVKILRDAGVPKSIEINTSSKAVESAPGQKIEGAGITIDIK